jgi:hypothetical protein
MSKRAIMLDSYELGALINWHHEQEDYYSGRREYLDAQNHKERRAILENDRKLFDGPSLKRVETL